MSDGKRPWDQLSLDLQVFSYLAKGSSPFRPTQIEPLDHFLTECFKQEGRLCAIDLIEHELIHQDSSFDYKEWLKKTRESKVSSGSLYSDTDSESDCSV